MTRPIAMLIAAIAIATIGVAFLLLGNEKAQQAKDSQDVTPVATPLAQVEFGLGLGCEGLDQDKVNEAARGVLDYMRVKGFYDKPHVDCASVGDNTAMNVVGLPSGFPNSNDPPTTQSFGITVPTSQLRP